MTQIVFDKESHIEKTLTFSVQVAPILHDVEKLRNGGSNISLWSISTRHFSHADAEHDVVQSPVAFATDFGEF